MATANDIDLINFLKTRHIPDNVINKFKEDKIDINVINVMTDEDLALYLPRYGDRLAIKAFCRQRRAWLEPPEVKSALKWRVRDKLQGQWKTASSDDTAGPGVGNRHTAKDSRRIEMGWLHFSNGNYHQVRTRHGGGTRHLSVQKTVTMEELLITGKDLFFPNGHSAKGPVECFMFDIRDFSHNIVPLECTVAQLYEQTKIRMLRIYLCSQEKGKEDFPKDVILSDTSSDFEPTENRAVKTRRMQRQTTRTRTRKYLRKTRSDHQLDHPDKSSDSDISPSVSTLEKHGIVGESSKHLRLPSDTSCTEILHSPSSDDVGNDSHQHTSWHEPEDAELFNNESDSHLAQAINASLEDFEVQFGPVSSQDGDSLDSTLPWNPDNINTHQHSTLNEGPLSSNTNPASPTQSVKEICCVTVRRISVVHDVIDIFMEPEVLNVELKMELKNEKAVDSDGVSREVYSAFWEHFLEQCEGEDERVPRLRPDFTEQQWQAVGRVWLKGYLDHNIIPIRLSPAFVLACCQGVSSVDEELLMMSFSRFISGPEQVAVEKALQGNMDETAEEDLLELFSRMGSHCLPSKDNLQASLLTMAHKVLLQEPKFIIDCFHSTIHNAVPSLTNKDSIMTLYDSKRSTNKNVAQMIKPTSESLNPQEQSALNHLTRYVRSTDRRKLEILTLLHRVHSTLQRQN